jgi:hypothetical protein
MLREESCQPSALSCQQKTKARDVKCFALNIEHLKSRREKAES